MQEHTRALFREIFAGLKPPPALTVSRWADKFRRLSSESSAEPGRWRTDKAPYQREIMDAVSDITVSKVVVKSAAQIGKTDALILNPIGYYMDVDPSPMMVMEPTLQLGEAFSKDRLSPMLRDTPALAGKVNEKSRNSGNTILHKVFPGGHITIVGANSAASLASRPIRILLADEIDRYPITAGNEGDPLLLAMKRLTTFWNKRIVCVSTPTIKGMSRIELEYENSTQEEWNVPCPQCGEYQPLVWAQVQYDREKPDDIHYVCAKCGVVSSEVDWRERFRDGKFVAAFPRRKVRGFHLNTLASTFVEWREIVEKYIEAKEKAEQGNPELLKTWTNTELGEVWEEEGEHLDYEELYKRREKYGCEVPDEVLMLTAGVDTQDNRFEIEVVGWGVGKESWGIKYHVMYGDLKKQDIWNELGEFLSQEFHKADGTPMRIRCTCMDSGGHFTNEVYRFCKVRMSQAVYAIKGYGGTKYSYINPPTKSNRAKVQLFKIGVDTGKSVLYQRLQVTDEGPNYCHFPRDKGTGYNLDYFRGLTAEQAVMTYSKGTAKVEWKLRDPSYRRNEPLDLRNYATAALEIVNPVLKEPGAKKKAAKKGRRTVSGGIE